MQGIYIAHLTALLATAYPADSAWSGQCDRLMSLIPDPQSGCCGWQAPDDGRSTAGQTTVYVTYYDAPARSYGDQLLHTNRPNKTTDVQVAIENRIAGGKETELYEYPWTASLLTIFVNGGLQPTLSCGGSLINSQFVLSAAHCLVHEKNYFRTGIEVTLAEYDKRTFPRDCKGSNCLENIMMYASNALPHPDFRYGKLVHDISLIRLNGVVPFNEYIRPICLPTFNPDDPRYANLELEVTGWGRNIQTPAFVKQATKIHLLSRYECERYYPEYYTHICAIGFRGEDTCIGDSGGPLMMVNEGQYYLLGVVSGKRTDVMCSSVTVPSIYTNVYYYLDWIQNNMNMM